MTVNGEGNADDSTRVDRTPPSFPSVNDAQASSSSTNSGSDAPIFTSAQTSPVTTTSVDAPQSGNGGGSRGGRLRWFVAALATILVVGLVGGVLLLAAPSKGAPSATAHYVPADTGMYAEVRLDLPGDQKDNLASFMSHFPGFADQASFQQKLDETLNTVLQRMPAGLNWETDVKPWFGGQVAVFGDLGFSAGSMMMQPGSGMSSSSMAHEAGQSVIMFTVTDKAKLQSVIDAHVGGSQVAAQDYQGHQIQTVAQPAGTSTAVSYVVTDDALLVSPNVDLLKQALDVKAGQKPALADDSYFLQQIAALHSDRLVTFYVDPSKQLAAMPAATDSLMPAQCTQIAQSALTSKVVGEVRAETDHLAFNTRSQIPTGDNAPPAPAMGSTTLAQSMPADTVFYMEMRNTGNTIGWLIKQYMTCLTAMPSSSQPGSGLGVSGTGTDPSQIFEQFLGASPDEYLNFIDDAAVGLSFNGDKPAGGLVATVDDQATATQRVDKLVSLLQMLSSFGGSTTGGMQITTDSADHNGIKVTTIHVVSPDTASPMNIQVATGNNKLYLGLDDFVTAALDRSSSDSLASNGRYEKAISDAPATNSGILYVDVADIASAMEANMPADQKANFETNTKPFLDALSSFSMVGHVDNGTLVNNGFLFVE